MQLGEGWRDSLASLFWKMHMKCVKTLSPVYHIAAEEWCQCHMFQRFTEAFWKVTYAPANAHYLLWQRDTDALWAPNVKWQRVSEDVLLGWRLNIWCDVASLCRGSFSLCFRYSPNFSVMKSSFSSRVKCSFCGCQSQDPTVLLLSLMWKLAGESYFCESERNNNIFHHPCLLTAFVPLIQRWTTSLRDEQ